MERELTYEEVKAFIEKRKHLLEESCFQDDYVSFNKLVNFLNYHAENSEK